MELSTAVSIGIVVSVAVGGVTTLFALRRRHGFDDLTRSYAAVIVALIVGSAGSVLVSLITEPVFLLGTFWIIYAPWTVFALQYSGRGHFLTKWRVFAGGLVGGGITLQLWLTELGLVEPSSLVQTITSVAVLAVLVVVFGGVTLVALSTYRSPRTGISYGVVAVSPVVGLLLIQQLSRPLSGSVTTRVVIGTGFVVITGALFVGVVRYQMTTVRPGVGSAGERAAVTTSDNPVIITDHTGKLERTNEAAANLFGDASTLDELIAADVETLQERETITRWSEGGRLRFNPQVTEVASGNGELVGHTITLVDITDQQIQEQRLQVLDRTLRHNIRNRLDVINAHAEAIDGEHARAIRRNADKLAQLSAEARRIESTLDTTEPTEVSALSLVETVTDDISAPDTDVEVTGSDTTVRISPEPCRYALHRVIGHLVTDDTASRVTVRTKVADHRFRVTITSDGTGISDSERAAIESGHEDQLSHATSLWLWGTEWIVRQMNGTLSFEDDAVVVTVPTD